jgi:hypothetical protein
MPRCIESEIALTFVSFNIQYTEKCFEYKL